MNTKTQQITLIALFLALCIVVPILFHVVGAGAMFLPMFVPIILAAFMIEFPQAILVGLLGPWLSAFCHRDASFISNSANHDCGRCYRSRNCFIPLS